jgi:hypothetical protein
MAQEFPQNGGKKPANGSPRLLPPSVEEAGIVAAGRTQEKPSDVMVARFEELPSGEIRPAMLPASLTTQQAAHVEVGTVSAWNYSVPVAATWSINQTRNAWILVQGVWKKIFNGNDGAFTALITLATQAKETGHLISYREEADGMIHEIYLW